ncbi:hypothetical protein MP228_000682 [Amoeboaphelidium protococcarum]|nr:hypothetical protein MP228_000682 [Amoeboaphelidium protococcarum]
MPKDDAYKSVVRKSLNLKGGSKQVPYKKKSQNLVSKPSAAEQQIAIIHPKQQQQELPLKMTDSERQAQEIRRKRLMDKLPELAKETHVERVQRLNKKLEKLTEHHDVPKVGPG